jgi:hypothetical protein
VVRNDADHRCGHEHNHKAGQQSENVPSHQSTPFCISAILHAAAEPSLNWPRAGRERRQRAQSVWRRMVAYLATTPDAHPSPEV